MKKRVKMKIGDLLRIPYMKGMHTYGRVLVDESVAIYDCPTSQDIVDFYIICKSEILFCAYVSSSAFEVGGWTVIGNVPLEDKLVRFYPRYFNPNPAAPTNLNFYEVYKDEIENAITKDWIKTGKIQLDGIYSEEHIEQRINDYYEGRRNIDNERSILLFKKMTGLDV